MRMLRLLSLLAVFACASAAPPRRVDTRMVVDEPHAVLSTLDKRAAGATIGDADWNRLFASEGYVRL